MYDIATIASCPQELELHVPESMDLARFVGRLTAVAMLWPFDEAMGTMV